MSRAFAAAGVLVVAAVVWDYRRWHRKGIHRP